MKSQIFSLNNFVLLHPTDNSVLVRNISDTIYSGDKIALIGSNGSGKSLLCKYIASQNANTSLLNQISAPSNVTLSIVDFISIHTEEWWNVLALYKKIFDEELDESTNCDLLSGGQFQKLNICIHLHKSSNIYIFDEPTNHLDLNSTTQFLEYIYQSNMAYILVLHDTNLLDQYTNKTWIVRNRNFYTFNTISSDAFELIENIKQNQIIEVERLNLNIKKVTKKSNSILSRQQVASKKINTAKKTGKLNMPKMLLGQMKNTSENSTKKLKNNLNQKIELMQNKINTLETEIDKVQYIELSTVKKGIRTIFNLENCVLNTNTGLALIENINIRFKENDRIILNGNNGCGKSLMLNSIFYKKPNLVGDIFLNKNIKIFYLDQHFSVIKNWQTIEQNIYSINNHVTKQDIIQACTDANLSQELYTNTLSSKLSGGQRLKLALIMSKFASANVLVLDEPTNHLDIESINVLVGSINRSSISAIVISHNSYFLSQLKNISQTWSIENKKIHVK